MLNTVVDGCVAAGFCFFARSWRTSGSLNSGCLVLMLARSPSTSFHGSVKRAKYHDESAPGGRAHRLVVVAHPLPQKSVPQEQLS